MAESPDVKKAGATEILLPGEGWVIQDWKCKEGSMVRKGETVAVACRMDSSQSSTPVISSSIDSESSFASHKRPNRRRRIAPTGSLTSNNETSAHPVVVAPFATIQQRLVSKLLSEKRVVGEPLAGLEVLSSNPVTDGSSQPKEATAPKKDWIRPIVAPSTGIFKKAPINTQSTTCEVLLIGFVEECLHPAFLEGICVVCGSSMLRGSDDDDENSEGNPTKVPLPSFLSSQSNKQPTTSQVTVSGGVTMTVSAEESRQMARQDTDRLLQHAKLSLVLDLDHTLVHATADPRARQFYEKEDVRTLRLPAMEGVQNQGMAPPGVPAFMQHYVKLRPHITKFLKSVQADYELTVYTAGTRQYAEEITVVLCRHMVGSRYDIDDLERLRYEVHMARIEYQKFQSLNQGTEKVEEDWKKSQEEENSEVCASDEPPVKKRKKVVSFGAPMSDSNDAEGDKGNASANFSGKSDHMTKEKLQILEKELQSAEELEKQAWELRQKLFGSRVVSRTDVGDLGRDVKSLKRIFPCGGTMAAVIDDREDVWANASDNSAHTVKGEPPDNLILVRPYHWQPFSGFADVNNAAGDDLSGGQSGNGDGEDPSVEKDVQLVWISRILKGLHRRFYRQDMDNRKSVPELLAEMRYQVLYGSTLVLSGLVPLNMKAIGADQARTPIVRYAQSLGARLVDLVEPGVTHVVAAKDGTDKCLAARKTPGCVLVKATWLVECYWSMTQRDTQPHLLVGGVDVPSASVPKKTSQESKIDNASSDGSGDSEGGDDDDDFAASFEDDLMG